jgi:DNA invertase Pin-like site-specific DNA recombinase
MRIGYARVSTDEQSLEVQVEQLKGAGCLQLFEEKKSAKSAERPVLQQLLRALEDTWPLEPYDKPQVLVVTKLDRLARNTRDLLEILDRIGKAGASFVSLAEPWADTTSPAGKLIMTVFAGVAQFERERTAERAAEGRQRARANGVHMGRRAALSREQLAEARRMAENQPLKTVARIWKVHPSTLRRNLKSN